MNNLKKIQSNLKLQITDENSLSELMETLSKKDETISRLLEENATLRLEKQETNQSLKELQKNNLSLKSEVKQIMDATPTFGWAYLNTDRSYKMVSQRYADSWDMTVESMIGIPSRDVIGDVAYECLTPVFSKALKGEKQEIKSVTKDKKGKRYHVLVTYVPVKNDEGQVIGVHLYTQDITKQELSRRALAKKNEELERYIESNLQLENFAHIASHDLKAPLGNVLNFSRLLEEQTYSKLNSEQQIFLDFIISSILKMQKTIEALLDFSLTSNKELNFIEVNPKELIDDLLIDVHNTIQESQATIRVEKLPEQIGVDKVLFRQLMQNLITNATKFVEKDSKPIVIVGGQEREKDFIFSVKDNGIGIPNEFKEGIFLLFKRLHTQEKFTGTGIGLATCKKIVELHKGEIWVESAENEGSTFFFSVSKKL